MLFLSAFQWHLVLAKRVSPSAAFIKSLLLWLFLQIQWHVLSTLPAGSAVAHIKTQMWANCERSAATRRLRCACCEQALELAGCELNVHFLQEQDSLAWHNRHVKVYQSFTYDLTICVSPCMKRPSLWAGYWITISHSVDCKDMVVHAVITCCDLFVFAVDCVHCVVSTTVSQLMSCDLVFCV